MAYFDWNATAPLLEASRRTWEEASRESWANPSTPYRLGVRTRLALEEAREEMAGFLGVDAGQVLFTSGATEANNGLLQEAARRFPDRAVWLSGVEHPSVAVAADFCFGSERVKKIPVQRTGEVDLGWLEDRLRKERPALVCVMAVNNETGVIQPWEEALGLCESAGVPFHCDAVQWAGKGKAGRDQWNRCAGVTLSGHKLGSPKGVGCLVLGKEWKGSTILAGGAQELGSRAGTENPPGVLAMVTAFRERMARAPLAPQARDHFERELLARWPGEVRIHGADAPRVWNTSSLCLPDYRAERWIARLDRQGFEVSSGSACSTGREGPSPVLRAMGVDDEEARRTLRISSGWETSREDWEGLLEAFCAVRAELGDPGPGGPGQVIEI